MSSLLSASLAYERRIHVDSSQQTPRRAAHATKSKVPQLRLPVNAGEEASHSPGKASKTAENQSPGTHAGKPTILPDLNGQASHRGPLSHPTKLSARDQPSMLMKLQKIINESGLFKDDDWQPEAEDRPPRVASPARLDVLRVVFAIFCDSAKVFKPILCMIQREYEAHVNLAFQAQERVDSLQSDLSTGYDSRQIALEEMKNRWKERLRRAHDAVTETKACYDDLRERFDKQADRIAELEGENEKLRASAEKARADAAIVQQENDKLVRTVNAHAFELRHINKVECEKIVQDEQINILTTNVAQMKTNHEMQELRYQNVVKEHGRFKAEIRHMKGQAKEWHEQRKGLSPRPEWKRITQFVAPLTQLPVVGSSSVVARRIVADLHHAIHMRRFALLELSDSLPLAPVTPAFSGNLAAPLPHSPAAEFPAEPPASESALGAVPEPECEVLMPPPPARRPSVALDDLPHPTAVRPRRKSISQDPPPQRTRRGSLSSSASLTDVSHSTPSPGPNLKQPTGRARRASTVEVTLVRMCPGLGCGPEVPVHLHSSAAVPIATLSTTDLNQVMIDFWDFRVECNIKKEPSSEQGMAEAFLAFLRQRVPSEQAALEASYSVCAALAAAAAGEDVAARLFWLALLGCVDENCVHAHREIQDSCREWTGTVDRFISFLAFKHPWVELFAERIRHVAAGLEGRGSVASRASMSVEPGAAASSAAATRTPRPPSTESWLWGKAMGSAAPLLSEETRDRLVEVVLELHVTSRRRLMQRFRNGLARATMFSVLDLSKPVTMVHEVVEPMIRDLEPNVEPQDLQTIINVGLSKRMYKEQLTPAEQLRVGVRSLQPFHKFLGVAKTVMADQMWMSMEELDHAVNDPRVTHLMENFRRFLTPGNAAPVNRVLGKLEAAV